MHTIFSNSEWEEELIRNGDQDQDLITTLQDKEAGLTGRLAGCHYSKAVRKSENYSAQIRVEERYRQRLIYFSALVLRKDGRATHNYKLEDLCFFQTTEFDFPQKDGDHPEFLSTVYEHVKRIKEEIEAKYFHKESK